MTSKEVAELANIWHTQVSRYADRLGVERGPKGWPRSLPAQIIAAREVADPREGAVADDLRVERNHLLVAQRRADGRRRVLARVPLTAANRRVLATIAARRA